MYFHTRSAHDDFCEIIARNKDKFPKGMINCFTGSEEELQDFLELGLYIGLSPLSFRTDQQIELIKKIPIDRILIATNSPFSSLNNNAAGY